MSRFVVIGSNSFSGAHFVAHLLRRGEEVIGVSRSAEPHPVFLPYTWGGQLPKLDFHPLDLTRDTDRIADLIASARAEIVVNFAAQSMVAESWDAPLDWFRTNVVATIGLHERLRRFDFIERYVHVSTPEVYGSCEGLVTEEAPLNPSTPYAVSRAAADMSLMSFFRRYGFPVVLTRAANVYGAGQQLYRIIPRTILFGLIGRKLKLHGGGRSVRSFIHIEDVATATDLAARFGRPGEVYHISTPRHVSIREVVEEVCRQLALPFDALVENADERPGHDRAYLLDTSKARQELGWAPSVELEDGIARTIVWAKENLDVLRKQPFDYVHKP